LRKNDRVVTECGCIVIPQMIVKVFGRDIQAVECPDHGNQVIVRKATGREVTEMVLGTRMPDTTATDTIPF